MSKVIFQRVDIAVTLKRTEDGGVLARVKSLHAAMETRLSGITVRKWLELGPDTPLPDLAEFLSLTVDSPTWKEWNEVEARSQAQPMTVLPRLTIDVADLELAALAWERSLRTFIPAAYRNSALVRVSQVFPRVASIPLTLPLRFLQVEPSPERPPLRDTIRRVFGSYSDEVVDQAIQTSACGYANLVAFRGDKNWPTVEVLHFDHLPTLDEPSFLLSTADPEQSGTLGWLERLADTWQTRLVTIHCDNLAQAAQARRLATALVNRGGPAVLVGYFPAGNAQEFYTGLYGEIVHDVPLDAGFYFATSNGPVLFVGAGRSEALRVSNISEGLILLADELAAPKSFEIRPVHLELRQMFKRLELEQPGERLDPNIALYNVQHYLNDKKLDLGNVVFESHEGEGILPLSNVLGNVRWMANLRPLRGVLASYSVLEAPVVPQPRYVNSHFWTWSDGELSRLDQKAARLILGETYHLGVQIGPEDEHVRVYGAEALLEEVFKWTPEMKGVWLEVGLTGLDFEVLGDPLQSFWLPRGGISETLYFAVIPQTPGVARLRFCVYYKSDLIQSFRIAALTQTPKDEDPPLDRRMKLLARALDLPVEEVGDVGYLPRLEYSVTAKLEDVPERPPRALSIVANDLDGSSVITLKGSDLFEIRTNDDLPDHIIDIRNTLERIATPPGKGNPDKWSYGFGIGYRLNAGNETLLKSALLELATPGWILYDAIVREKGRKRLAEILQPEKQTIHVAHILLDKVIPWAVLYDRQYDAERELDEDLNPVAHDVCLAALPDENGNLPVSECGKHLDCLLHPDRCKKRQAKGEPSLLPETVVCPLHFWGFKHIIELPPQQTSTQAKDGGRGKKARGREQESCILASQPAQMTAGIHARLPLADDHVRELEDLVNGLAKDAVWKSRASHRDIILKNLKDTTLDLIYFYCHASNQDKAKGIVDPYLEFQDLNQAKPRRINAAAMDYDQGWIHHPLVFLNGCRTAGFSPKALSPFIVKLVEGRGAAGVIGTEISVWEQLASEIALCFLREFLNGHPAGEALLTARRILLAQYNPLGLVYTLYAAANLMLDLDGDGRCMPD